MVALDFYFLTKACQLLPTGTVYAVFAGIGTVGTALMDVFLFDSSLSYSKVFFIIILVIGVVSLKLADDKVEENDQKGMI